MGFILNWIVTSIAIAIATAIVPGIVPFGPVDAWIAFALAGLMLSLVNSLVKPIISLLSIPITIITLGIFQLVVNGFMLSFASWLAVTIFGAGIAISGPWAAFGGAIIVSIMCSILGVATQE